jgi:VanZ family protein
MIFTLSAQPNLKPPIQFSNSDKMYHLLEYGGLGLLLARAIRSTGRLRSALHVGLLALCFGIVVGTCDEMFQSTVPGRQSSGFDLMADTLGIAVAQLVYGAWARE